MFLDNTVWCNMEHNFFFSSFFHSPHIFIFKFNRTCNNQRFTGIKVRILKGWWFKKNCEQYYLQKEFIFAPKLPFVGLFTKRSLPRNFENCPPPPILPGKKSIDPSMQWIYKLILILTLKHVIHMEGNRCQKSKHVKMLILIS